MSSSFKLSATNGNKKARFLTPSFRSHGEGKFKKTGFFILSSELISGGREIPPVCGSLSNRWLKQRSPVKISGGVGDKTDYREIDYLYPSIRKLQDQVIMKPYVLHYLGHIVS